MLIEHTFVTTMKGPEAVRLTAAVLGQAGFVVTDSTDGNDSPGDIERLEMSRAGIGAGPGASPQGVKLEYDRGRVSVALTITPATRRTWLATPPEPSATSRTGQRYANLMLCLAEALERLLAEKVAPDAAMRGWRAADLAMTPTHSTLRTVRRVVTVACLAVIVLSIAARAVVMRGRHDSQQRRRSSSAYPEMVFPQDEDAIAQPPAQSDPFAQDSMEELQAEVAGVMSNGYVRSGADAKVVFSAANRLDQDGRFNEAVRCYALALQAAPAESVHRLEYADLLARLGRRDSAVDQAKTVLDGCEDPTLARKAQAVIGGPSIAVEPLQPLPAGKPILVLVPMGDVDLLLLRGEREKLAHDLGIEVRLRSVPMSFSAGTRNPLKETADVVRAQLNAIREKDPELFERAMQVCKITEEDLADDQKLVRFAALLIRKGGHGLAGDELGEEAQQPDTQWFADDMFNGIADALRGFKRPNVRFMGITRSDIFGEDSNCYFSYGDRGFSVVSYHRFLAVYNEELPDRARLARRLHREALANAATLFGLEHCPNPHCPCSCAAGVEGEDGKSDEICAECRKGFEEAFKKCDAR